VYCSHVAIPSVYCNDFRFEQMTVNCCTGAEGWLTKTPQNVLVLQSQDAIFNCSTNETADGHNHITWKHEHSITAVRCMTFAYNNHEFIVIRPDSATDCNLQALGSKGFDISGEYVCISYDSSQERAIAYVILLGKLRSYKYNNTYNPICMQSM